MAAKIITNLILIIALAALQIAFISGLPGRAADLNLILVILIFILGLVGFSYALVWSLALGFILEIYSFLPFGAALISLALTVVIADFLLNYLFTNRSLYSFLALTGLATVSYELAGGALATVLARSYLTALPGAEYFGAAIFSRIGLNLLAAFFIFYLIYFLIRNLKPVFLIKNTK